VRADYPPPCHNFTINFEKLVLPNSEEKKGMRHTHGVSGDRPRRAEYSCGDSDGAGGEGGAGSKFAD